MTRCHLSASLGPSLSGIHSTATRAGWGCAAIRPSGDDDNRTARPVQESVGHPTQPGPVVVQSRPVRLRVTADMFTAGPSWCIVNGVLATDFARAAPGRPS